MHSLSFATISAEFVISTGSARDGLLIYPDYLVGVLLRAGVGRIKAERCRMVDDKVEFVLTPWKHGCPPTVVCRLSLGDFRTVLARFGVICKAQNLYASLSSFSCEHDCHGQIRSHRFSLFICNEPTMDIWLRLYLYGIAGGFPKIS